MRTIDTVFVLNSNGGEYHWAVQKCDFRLEKVAHRFFEVFAVTQLVGFKSRYVGNFWSLIAELS